MPSPTQLKFALKVDISHEDLDSPAPPPSPRDEEEVAGLSMRSLLGNAVAERERSLPTPTMPSSATPPPTRSPCEYFDAPLAASLPASRAVSRRPSSAFLTGVNTSHFSRRPSSASLKGVDTSGTAYRPSTPAALYYLSRSAPGSTSVSRGELIGAARHRRPPSAVTAPPSVLPSRTGSPAWSRPSSAFSKTTLPRNHSQPTFGQFSGKFYDVRCSNTGTPRGGAGAKGTPTFGGTRRFNRDKCYEGKANANVQRGQYGGVYYDVRCSKTGTPRGGAGAKGTPTFHSADHLGSTRRFNRDKCYEGKVNAAVQRGQYGGVFYDARCSNTGTPRWQKPTASFGKRRPTSATELRLVMHRAASPAA